MIDIINDLKSYNIQLDVVDSWVDISGVSKDYGIEILNKIPNKKYDAIIIAVSHDEYFSLDIRNIGKQKNVIFDIKGVLNEKNIDLRL